MSILWNRALPWAIVLYCLAGIIQIRQKPGLQHDEALLVLGAVHMRHAPEKEITIPHDPDTWIDLGGFWAPLMTARYVGAIKEYLCLPVFAIFGTRTAMIRLLSLLLGAIGIWGLGRLIQVHLDTRVAALSAVALAINPSYVANTVFDNGTVSIFMASMGLLALAISAYLSKRTRLAAFAVGFTIGFGIWARVNFIWLAGALFLALFVTLRARLLRIPLSHWLLAAAGAIAGSLPLIVYQIISHGGTWQAVGMFASHDSLSHRLYIRLIGFAEALLSDREHRAMFDGAAMPAFERWLFPLVVAVACIAGLAGKLWSRILSLTFLLFAATLFFSSLTVAEHHLVELLPLAAVITVLACFTFPKLRCASIALAVVYLCCVFQWQAAAITGLKRTGGVGVWSDGLIPLAEHLEANYSTQDIKILDWGLLNNLYVVTDGRLHLRDIYGMATPERSGLNRSWLDELNSGGVFVLFAARRQMPEATESFLKALADDSPVTHRWSAKTRDGAPYADVIEVDPNTAHAGSRAHISTADPSAADRLEGFHQIESGWRWSERKFAITLDAPTLEGAKAARVSVDVYIPDALIQQLGSVTLSARAGNQSLAPETWRTAGNYTYIREVSPHGLHTGANRIEFSLEKSIPPREGDKRELGIIVQAASLEALR